MEPSRKVVWTWLAALLCTPLASSAQTAVVQRVHLLPTQNAVEIEIQLSQPVAPRTQVVPSPDRLVIDFPQASPGPQLRALPVNRGDVKAVRVGLFTSTPPTTRVVLDLNSAAGYQIFPSGKSVIVKIGGPASAPAADASPAAQAPPEPPKPKVTVAYQNGLLRISADKATLAQVLYEIHTQTGAEIAIPSGAEQEQVFTELGPAPAKEVMAALLNGSPYNFILIGSASNPNALERVLLTQKGTSLVLDMSSPQAQPSAQNAPPVYVNPGRAPIRRNPTEPPPPTEDQINDLPDDDEPQPSDPQQPPQNAQPNNPPNNPQN